MKPLKTMACWSDLLGFGSRLNDLGWDLNNDTGQVLASRLVKFASLIMEHAAPVEQGIFINDGLIRTLDPHYFSGDNIKAKICTWLDNCIMTHCRINQSEKDKCLPGVRSIICQGQVLDYEPTTISHYREPFQSRKPITQLNTALSKCYLADQAGSRVGMKKGSVYIEENIIDYLVKELGYLKHDDFLFSYPDCFNLDDHSKYQSIDELLFIKDPLLREDAEDSPYRVPWFKFGDKVFVESGNLKFYVVEVLAYSPIEEFALCWYDTFSGAAHGVTRGAAPDLNTLVEASLKEQANPEIIRPLAEYAMKINMQKHIKYVNPGTPAYDLLLQILR